MIVGQIFGFCCNNIVCVMRNMNVASEREFPFRFDEDRWIYTSEIRYCDGLIILIHYVKL